MKTKELLQKVMRQAWMLVKTYGFSMSEAMKQSWAVAKLRKAMRNGVVKFLFTKQDGSVRTAWGTLKEGVIGAVKGTGVTSPTCQTYWDCERNAYRCFKVANFIRMA